METRETQAARSGLVDRATAERARLAWLWGRLRTWRRAARWHRRRATDWRRAYGQALDTIRDQAGLLDGQRKLEAKLRLILGVGEYQNLLAAVQQLQTVADAADAYEQAVIAVDRADGAAVNDAHHAELQARTALWAALAVWRGEG